MAQLGNIQRQFTARVTLTDFHFVDATGQWSGFGVADIVHVAPLAEVLELALAVSEKKKKD